MRLVDIVEPVYIGGGGASANPSPEAIRTQLDRLRTAAFSNSCKLFSFLRFVVDEALEGRGATLKEIVIGVELYSGFQGYDPRTDSTVRVEARRLRRKLEAYYAIAGAADDVVISIPTGRYTPSFSLRSEDRPSCTPQPRRDGAPALAVLPFTSLSLGEREEAFADGVTDELIYAAERDSSFRVAPRAIIFQYRGSRFSLTEVALQTSSDFVLHGTIRRAHDLHRVSIELTDRSGQVLWSDRMDMDGNGDFDLQERMAAKIIGRLSTPSIHSAFSVQAA
jgi:TolB-like protein